MSDAYSFAAALLLVGVVGLLAVLSNRISERIQVPAPAFFLAGAAVAAALVHDLHAPPQQDVQRLVTVALVCILFDGGMHIGWYRFRPAAAPDRSVVGVAGTFLTVGGGGAGRCTSRSG